MKLSKMIGAVVGFLAVAAALLRKEEGAMKVKTQVKAAGST
jgi:hypothetical protein